MTNNNLANIGVNVTIDNKKIILLGIGVFFAVLAGIIVSKLF